MKSKSGFTLVELSIVLVIIGLLIGGILVAQSMVSTARINSQVQQLQQFDIAINNFRTKYQGLPGDNLIIPHDSCQGGDNNGYIDGKRDSGCVFSITGITWAGNAELANFFYQLTSLDLLKTTRADGQPYSRSSDAGTVYSDKQFPMSKLDKELGIIVAGNPAWDKNYYFFNRSGRPSHQMDYHGSNVLMSAKDALAVDLKLDDGKPLTGTARSIDLTNNTSDMFDGATFGGFWRCDDGVKYLTATTSKCQFAVEILFSN